MIVREWTNGNRTNWREIVRSFEGNPLLLPEVSEASESTPDLLFLTLHAGDDRVGCALGNRTSRKFLGLFGGRPTLHLVTPPAVAAGIGKEEALTAFAEYLAGKGYGALSVGQGWGEDYGDSPAVARFIERTYIEFVLDLTRDRETLDRGIHRKHLKNVRRAYENGLVLETCDRLETFLLLRDMQEASSERASERGNDYRIQEERFFRRAYKAVYKDGPGRVLLAKRDEGYVAAFAWLTFGSRAITVRSGATREGYESSAMHLLQYELIRRLKEEGVKQLNIGGVPEGAADTSHPNHGLYNFKRYFGGTPSRRTSLKVIL
jgi:hypothetical protein